MLFGSLNLNVDMHKDYINAFLLYRFSNIIVMFFFPELNTISVYISMDQTNREMLNDMFVSDRACLVVVDFYASW